MTDKIESLIGFAVKAGKIIYGIDNIETMHKKRFLIVACNSLSERSLNHLKDYAQNKRLPMIRFKNKLLEEAIHKENCKVIAITDKQMSQAIMQYINGNYEVLTSEVE